VPLGELLPGEQLRCLNPSLQTSPFQLQTSAVLSVTILTTSIPVYNIEVHGEHVYQVGQLEILVHNTEPCNIVKALNTKVIHAAQRTMQRHPGAFNSVDEAAAALRQLTASIRAAKSFPPAGSVPGRFCRV
jgi:hypothetical protein